MDGLPVSGSLKRIRSGVAQSSNARPRCFFANVLAANSARRAAIGFSARCADQLLRRLQLGSAEGEGYAPIC